MAKKQSIIGNAELKELMNGNGDFLKPLVQQIVQAEELGLEFTKDVPDHVQVVGLPARITKELA